jgi:lincosamide nucleotidyltransferase A/C/D/E
MVSAEDALRIYKNLEDHNIVVWLSGGWGIDALLGEHTRPHKDLDVIMLLDDVHRLWELLTSQGYTLKEIWSENRWVIDEDENRVATAFVLHDSAGREFDAHAMRLDHRGNGQPAWDAGDFMFKKEDLDGLGLIAGGTVRCLTPQVQMALHAGYQLPDAHSRDLDLLHEKFGVAYPDD